MKNTAKQYDLIFQLAKKRVKALKRAINKESSQDLSDELIHQLRVCSKKLRALLQLYRANKSKNHIKKVDHAIKEIAQTYSAQRDAFVQHQLLYDALTICKLSIDDVQPLLNSLLNKTAQNSVQMDGSQVHDLFKKVLSLWKEMLNSPSKNLVNKGINFSYQKAQQLAIKAVKEDDDEDYHQCRKWTKYLFYQLQQLNFETTTVQNQLNQLGDILGKFHDRCVLENLINKQLSALTSDNNDTFISSINIILTWLQNEKVQYKIKCQQHFSTVFSNKRLML